MSDSNARPVTSVSSRLLLAIVIDLLATDDIA